VRGQKDACTPGLIFGDESWRSRADLREAGQRQASWRRRHAAKPSHVVLWHELIDAASPVCKNAVTAAVRLLCSCCQPVQ